MRNVCLRAIILVAAVAALMAPAHRADAQQLQTLVDFTSAWKYDSSTTLGTAWTNSTFNDTAWASGMGLLGSDTTPAVYPVAFNTALLAPANGGPTTYYFRANFTFNGATGGATLIASNLVDDGCVIYLNGGDAGRLRVAAGQTATTFATGGPATEGAIEVLTLPIALLRQGANVLAVEVHQTDLTSSDVAWGMKLVVSTATALSITTQPQSQTVAVGSPANFSVGISGGPVSTYRWQKNNADISGASGSTYSIPSVVAGDAGNFRVIVSNAVNVVTSQVAVLTVVADVTGPVMLNALVRETTTTTNQIDITFDESVTSSSGVNIANYLLRRYDNGVIGASVPIISAQANNRLVRLLINTTNVPNNWFYRSNYFLTVSNVADTSGNLIIPGSTMGVSWAVTVSNVTQMSDNWDFYDNGWQAPLTGDPYANSQWTRTNYVVNPNFWGNGPGILAFGIDVSVACDGVMGGPIQPSYGFEPILFRRTFNVATNYGRSGTLRFRHFLDDGGIIYLNGVEIARINMPASVTTITTNSRAASSVTATCIPDLNVVVTNLLPGMNWLAAGVCDGATRDDEIAFGLEMDGIFQQKSPAPPSPTNPPPVIRPTMSIVRNGANFSISWSPLSAGFVLQSTTNSTFFRSNNIASGNLTNWVDVPGGATSPVSVPVNSERSRYYRLRKP